MTVLIGHNGRVKLSRTTSVAFQAEISSDDVVESLNRVGVEGAINNLLTGDKVDIVTEDSRGLAFFPIATWPTATSTEPSITAFVNVNTAGGLRFFATFADAVNNNRAAEYTVQTFAGAPIPVSILVSNYSYNVLGNVSSYELNTEREDVDITTLNDKFRQRYSAGLISGSGQISTYFSYETTGIGETPLLLLQTMQRLEAGSRIDLALFLSESSIVSEDNVYYEVEAMVVRSGVTVSADGIIEATIDFVSTGEVKLLIGAATSYVLKEDDDRIELEQSLDYLLTEVEDQLNYIHIQAHSMADQRITELTELLEASVAANDVLPIVDISASQTKKVKVSSLIEGGLTAAGSGIIDLGKLDQTSATKIGTIALADSGVTASKLADDSSIFVGTLAPASGNFEGRGFFDSSNGTFSIYSAGNYTTVVSSASGLADGSVTTAKLADGAVTTGKISASGLGTAALADEAVTTAKVASGAITSVKIATGAVATSQIANGAVGSSQLAASGVNNAALAADAVNTVNITDGAVTTTKLGDGAVTNDKLANTTISYDKLNLSDGSVPGGKLTDNSIATAKLQDGGVTAVKIADDAITSVKLGNGAVTSSKLGSSAVTSAAIDTGAVTTGKINANAVTYDKIQAVSATDRLLGRSSAGSGNVEEISCTSAGRDIIAAADAAAQRSVLGLGNIALATGTWTNGSSFSGTSTGTNTGDQTIQLTGDITGLGTGSFATTISNEVVTAAKIAENAVTTIKIAADAVTAAKLADQSATVIQAGAPTGSGSFTGQQYINTSNNITYYWNGSTWATQSVSVPEATSSVTGTVKVGTGLEMNEAGQLDHLNNITTGTFTKITLDAQGHATNGTVLDPSDIPNLDASKITTGTFSSDFLAPNSVTAEQLADNGIALVSETAPNPQFAGQWWVNPSDRSTYIWVGSVGPTLETSNGYWLNLGYGNLQQENLRFGGTYTASGNTVETTTTYSVQAGIDVGEALPAPSEANNGLYYIVTASGTGTNFAPNEALAPGDWVVSLGQGTNWERLDFGSAVAGVSDEDVLVNGPALVPAASGVATQQGFNESVWTRVQVATTSVNGIVRASSEIEVSASGVMTIGIADDGTY